MTQAPAVLNTSIVHGVPSNEAADHFEFGIWSLLIDMANIGNQISNVGCTVTASTVSVSSIVEAGDLEESMWQMMLKRREVCVTTS